MSITKNLPSLTNNNRLWLRVCVLSSMWPPEEQRERPGTFQNYSSFWHVTLILQPIGSLVFDYSTLPAHIPLDVPLAPTPNPLQAAKSKLVSSHSSWKTSPWPMRSNMAYSRLGFCRMICQNPSRYINDKPTVLGVRRTVFLLPLRVLTSCTSCTCCLMLFALQGVTVHHLVSRWSFHSINPPELDMFQPWSC